MSHILSCTNKVNQQGQTRFQFTSLLLLICFFLAFNPATAQNGLAYKYYEGAFDKMPQFSNLNAKKKGKVSNFNLSIKERENKFALVYEGFYDIKKSGKYVFQLVSDDGSKLYIDGNLIVDNDTKGITRKRSSEKYLAKGFHKIRLEYFDKFDRHRLTVLVKGPDFSFRKILSSNLYVSSSEEEVASSPASSPAPSPVDENTATKIYKNQVFDGGPYFILREEDSGTQFINCTFKNYRRGTALRIEGAENVIIRNCKFVSITNNTKGRDAHAIECNKQGKNVIVENSFFKDLGADGIQLGHSGNDIRNWLIRDNEFVDCGENGIDVKAVQGNIIVQNNLFKGSSGCPRGTQIGCTGDEGVGMIIHRGARGVVVNGNTFIDNVHGLKVSEGAKSQPPVNITVKNNFFNRNSKYGLRIRNAGSTLVFNNTFLNNGQENFRVNIESNQKVLNRNNLFIGKGGKCNQYDGKGNLYFGSLDQAGIKLDQGKPVLKSSSPVIDRGISISQVDLDIYRNRRPQGSSLDCGAVEFTYGTNARFAEEEKSLEVVQEETHSDNFAEFSELKIFPNPASEQVNIMLNQAASQIPLNVSLVDLQGKQIWQNNIQNVTEIKIPVGHLKSGIYLLLFEGKGTKESRKLVIRH